MATTTYLQLNQPAYNSSAWDVPLNANETILDNAFGGTTSVSLVASNVTLTSTQLQAMQLRFTGAISANITIYVPSGYYGRWTVTNATTGAFTLTIASAAGGTTYAVAQGYSSLICCDSTGVFASDSGILQGGTLPSLSVTGNTTLGTSSGNTLTVNATSTFASPATYSSTSTYNGATAFNATATFSGAATTASLVTDNILESSTISGVSATGTINFDALTQSILYYTANATANFTLNIRGSSSTALNSVMSTGQTMTIAFLNTNGTTAYYLTSVTIDGSAVTPKWQNSITPSSGNASSIDIYTLTIIKTGSATYTILGSQVRFA